MGFDIQTFIDKLDELVHRESLSNLEKVNLLEFYITEMKKHAKECGVID